MAEKDTGSEKMPYLENVRSTLFYREAGSGPPVIALHGSAATSGQWRFLAGCLEGRFRVIAPDLPGYGRSEPLEDGAADLARVAARLVPLIDNCGEPVHLVGHSFGGAVALKIALAMPERVKSLTLIEPAAFHLLHDRAPAETRLHAEIRAVADDLRGFVEEGDPWNGMARFIDFWIGRGAWARTSDALRLELAASIGQVNDDFAAIFAEADRLGDCARVARPTLCVMGLESPAVSMRVTELLAEAIPGARLEMVPEAGHLAQLTDPHVVDPMIRRHLLAAEEGLSAALRAAA
jgi:pimeloyl-ACP methyl ester carboxylesterase